MDTLTAKTRVFALLGDPVAHSLSPTIQNAAIRATGVDGVYVALRCGAADLPGLLRGIAAAGGGGNVTVPHKELAARVVDAPTAAVVRTGACNTFWWEDGRIRGDNTDVAGFRAAVRALVGAPAGARVLLLGAGGAARGALHVLLEDGVASVALYNRTPGRATDLRAAFGDPGCIRVVTDRAALRGERFDLAVNATSLGLHPGDPLPLDFDEVDRVGAALDLVYAVGGTRWVHEAHARGLPAADGLEMLIHQGAAAFERWWGRPAPLDAMREALSMSSRIG
jgi:shikimate dehydrogenase